MNASQICNMLDADLIRFIHNIIVIIKIAVPIILVILGMLDFAKGVTSGKEDEIKKGQGIFIKRLIAGACVFFVVTIVQLVMSFVSSDDNSFWNCANQILNGTGGTTYVPSGVSGNNSNGSNYTNKQNQTNNQNNTQNNSQNNENKQPFVDENAGESHTSNSGNTHGGGGSSWEGNSPSGGASESHTSDSGYSHGGNGTNYDTQNNGHW